MLLLGHAGITLGMAILLKNILCLWSKAQTIFSSPSEEQITWQNTGKTIFSPHHPVDYRFILFGSLLPDIIDKPVGSLLFISGRTIGHSLFFFIALTIVALWLYKSHSKPWLLFLSFGTLMHLVLDQMWLKRDVLFWPVYGWFFPVTDGDCGSWQQLFTLFTDPAVYIPEIIGGIILVIFMAGLIRRKKIYAFITNGNW